MKFVVKSALLAVIFLAPNLLHAQETAAIPSSPANLSSLESYSDAQLGQVLNELAAMPLIWPTNLPDNGMGGTYWSLAHPNWPPLPSMSGAPAWEISSNFFLLDDIDYPETVSANSGISPMGMLSPMDSGSGGFSPSFSFPTNGVLWLQITNVADNMVYANLNNGTDFVYQIFSLTNLSMATAVSNWNTEMAVFPGINTNVMPFTVSMNDRNPLFLWARDWTGITNNGNQTPSWWFWLYFGAIDLSDTNLDSFGNTLLSDYQNDTDPNVIQFSIAVTNQYVNSANMPIQINVTAGEPYYIATLIDSTNFAGADWSAYTSSNITVNLGSLQGWHNVYVGLRGLPANATQTWQWQHLDFVSRPLLVLTKPFCSAVDEPIIQIYGYCQELLASITYDISNASGIRTNQLADITDQYFDTNAFGITTNYFDCLDVQLTNGLNTITMHATDFAGDTTTTNFDFTVDYSNKTNPPALQIGWPQNGTQISGNNFTCNGWISDPTATVTASFILTNGNTNVFPNGIYTNIYSGEVGRDGSFSFENLLLNPGSNTFTISVADVVGNMAATNISVIQTNFVLTINPVSPDSQLWQPTVTLTGTISDPTYAVWANGVKGTNYGNGTWSVNNVPVSNANFTATAYAPNEQQPDGSFGN